MSGTGVKTNLADEQETLSLVGSAPKPIPAYFTLSYNNDPNFMQTIVGGEFPENPLYYGGIVIPDPTLTAITGDAEFEDPDSPGNVLKAAINPGTDLLADPSDNKVLQMVFRKTSAQYVINELVNRVAVYTAADILIYIAHFVPTYYGTDEIEMSYRQDYQSEVTLDGLAAGDIDKIVIADARLGAMASDLAKLSGFRYDHAVGTTQQKNELSATKLISEIGTLSGKVHILEGDHPVGTKTITGVEFSRHYSGNLDLTGGAIITLSGDISGKIKVINAGNDSILITGDCDHLVIDSDNDDCLKFTGTGTVILNGDIVSAKIYLRTEADVIYSERAVMIASVNGSGTGHSGKHSTASSTTSINQGIWVSESDPNIIHWGRISSADQGGTSETAYPVLNSQGCSIPIKYAGTGSDDETNNIICPEALNDASLLTRTDLWGVELIELDVETTGVVFVNNVHYGKSTCPELGIPLTDIIAAGAFTDVDKFCQMTTGSTAITSVYAHLLADLTPGQLQRLGSNKEIRLYRGDDGKLKQRKFPRIRVIAGLGDNWANPSDSFDDINFNVSNYVKPQGQLVSITSDLANYNVNETGRYAHITQAKVSELGATIGTSPAINKADTGIDTSIAYKGQCFFLPITTVLRNRNQGIYHQYWNKWGTKDSDKMVNSDFASDISGWSPYSSSNNTWESGRMKCTATGTAIGTYRNVSGLVTGQKYKVVANTQTYIGEHSGYFALLFDSTVFTDVGGSYIDGDLVSFTGTFTASATSHTIYLQANTGGITAGEYIFIDNFSVEPILESTADCFDSNNYGVKTGAIGNSSAHPSGQFYDQISAEQIKDLRNSARVTTDAQRELQEQLSKVLAGTMRGSEDTQVIIPDHKFNNYQSQSGGGLTDIIFSLKDIAPFNGTGVGAGMPDIVGAKLFIIRHSDSVFVYGEWLGNLAEVAGYSRCTMNANISTIGLVVSSGWNPTPDTHTFVMVYTTDRQQSGEIYHTDIIGDPINYGRAFGALVVEDDASVDNTGDWSGANLVTDNVGEYLFETSASQVSALSDLSYSINDILNVTVDIKDGTATGMTGLLIYQDGHEMALGATTSSWKRYSVNFTVTATTTAGQIGMWKKATMSGLNIQFKNFKVTNVTDSAPEGTPLLTEPNTGVSQLPKDRTTSDLGNGYFVKNFFLSRRPSDISQVIILGDDKPALVLGGWPHTASNQFTTNEGPNYVNVTWNDFDDNSIIKITYKTKAHGLEPVTGNETIIATSDQVIITNHTDNENIINELIGKITSGVGYCNPIVTSGLFDGITNHDNCDLDSTFEYALKIQFALAHENGVLYLMNKSKIMTYDEISGFWKDDLSLDGTSAVMKRVALNKFYREVS